MFRIFSKRLKPPTPHHPPKNLGEGDLTLENPQTVSLQKIVLKNAEDKSSEHFEGRPSKILRDVFQDLQNY